MKTDYNAQAKKFLEKTKTTLEIVEAKQQTAPLWKKEGEKHGIKYQCTLKNNRHTYIFNFWDSIHNAEIIEALITFCPIESQKTQKDFNAERILKMEGIRFNYLWIRDNREKEISKYRPKEYDVLACLNPLQEDNFEEFCNTFGYDNDSITAKKTFDACIEQDRNLRKLWNIDELLLLNEIQ